MLSQSTVCCGGGAHKFLHISHHTITPSWWGSLHCVMMTAPTSGSTASHQESRRMRADTKLWMPQLSTFSNILPVLSTEWYTLRLSPHMALSLSTVCPHIQDTFPVCSLSFCASFSASFCAAALASCSGHHVQRTVFRALCSNKLRLGESDVYYWKHDRRQVQGDADAGNVYVALELPSSLSRRLCTA